MFTQTKQPLKLSWLIALACCIQLATAQEMASTRMAPDLTSITVASRLQKNEIRGTVSLKADSLSLREILGRIESQSRYVFIYADDEISAEKQISIDVTDKPLATLLEDILLPLRIEHKLYGRQIVLRSERKVKGDTRSSRTRSSNESYADSLSGSLRNAYVEQRFAQANAVFTVSGIVTDEANNPLPGVNVLEKGTTNGTVSDSEGKYRLDVSGENAVLVFSFIGYLSDEAQVAGRASINMQMMPDIQTLSEVVVVGYGEQKRSDVTGAIATVKTEDIKNLPVQSVADALQGRVAGVYVTSSSGQPGSAPNITVRGPGSLGGVAPLYVVDGMPIFGTGFNFNIQDIESMEVIKDASAAAIYGTLASGGVILITTKKGKSQKPKVGANANYGVRNVFNLPELLQTEDYIRAKTANGGGPYNAPNTYANTNWFDELFNTATEQNYTGYLSGGSEHSNFYTSINYQSVEGVMIDNTLERYTLRLNSEHAITKKLSIGQTFYGTYTQGNPLNNPNSGPLNFRSTPLVPVYDSENTLGGWGRDNETQRGNPVADQFVNYNRNEGYDINAAAFLRWEILKGLSFETNGGVTVIQNNGYYFNYRYDFGLVKRSTETFGRNLDYARRMLANFTLNYEKTFGDHNIAALVGYEARKDNDAGVSGQAFYPLVPLAPNSSLSSADTLNRPSFYAHNNYRLLSQFARLDYSFKGKYLVQVNVRRDGVATVFGPGNKYGTFPSMSVGWKIHEEDFMSTLPIFSNLKLRASYGKLGNFQGINSFLFVGDYSTNGFAYDYGAGKSTGITLSNKLPNRDIRWESLLTTNIGLDIGLLEGRVNVSLDWYNRKTEDMVYTVPLPRSAGLGPEVLYNIGEMSNRGFEIAIDYRNNVGDFTYGATFTGAFNRNELVSLTPDVVDQQIIDGWASEIYSGQNISRSVPGKAMGQFWGWETRGIYQQDDPQGPVIGDATPRAGDLIYVDQNNDGTINDKDKVFIGNPWPKFTYGLNVVGGWKGLDLRLFFTGVQGVDIYNTTSSYEHFFYNDYNTTGKVFETSFFGDNGVTEKPRSTQRNWSNISDYHVENGSYLRLKNVQLGYAIPRSLLDKAKISSLRVFVMSDNLLTITPYTGIDPESALSGSVKSKGIDNATYRYPLSRLYSVGLNIEF